MNQQALSSFIWSVADLLRGDYKQSEYGNTKEQFANSPDLANEIMNVIMDAMLAHSAMSTQALNSEKVRAGLQDVLLGPAKLYETLRERADCRPV